MREEQGTERLRLVETMIRLGMSGPRPGSSSYGDISESRDEAAAIYRQFIEAMDRDVEETTVKYIADHGPFESHDHELGFRHWVRECNHLERLQWCVHCEQSFVRSHNRQMLCSEECQRERARVRRRRPEPEPRACDQCSEKFTPTRSDARYCSNRCRVAAHRATTKETRDA